MTSTDTPARRAGDPAPDLTDYRVVHRAMTVDLDRLATAAAELVDRPDPARLAALRHYLGAVSGEITSHHRVEDDHVWPLLEAVAGDRTALVALTDDHDRLDPLLERAADLAARDRATPELVAVLREVADLLLRHVADEERDIFPIIVDRVRVADYLRIQERFRANLGPRLLPFVVPWVLRHATADERARLLAEAGPALRVLNAVFARRFRTRERLVFGPAGLSRDDRRLLAVMRRFSVVHRALMRRGLVGRRWLGGSELVLLTVTGRRSGRPITVPLIGLPDGDDEVVAASQGGVDAEPQWWRNLQAQPRAAADFRGERFTVVARQVDDAERAALWARFVATTDVFAGYQAKVRREIAVVRLHRAR